MTNQHDQQQTDITPQQAGLAPDFADKLHDLFVLLDETIEDDDLHLAITSSVGSLIKDVENAIAAAKVGIRTLMQQRDEEIEKRKDVENAIEYWYGTDNEKVQRMIEEVEQGAIELHHEAQHYFNIDELRHFFDLDYQDAVSLAYVVNSPHALIEEASNYVPLLRMLADKLQVTVDNDNADSE